METQTATTDSPIFLPYPSIRYLKQAQSALNTSKDAHQVAEENKGVLTYQGTVKLHGSHGDIRRPIGSHDLIIQSRNRILTVDDQPKTDNHGFAKFILDRSTLFHAVLDKIEQHLYKCSTLVPSTNDELMISGEFCGKHIHTGTGLGLLNEPIFVIFDISLIKVAETNDACNMERDIEFLELGQFRHILDSLCSHTDVHQSSHRVYHILQFDTYEIQMSMGEDQDDAEISNTVKQLTHKVGECCPVASVIVPVLAQMPMGSNQGGYVGEGLVWKPMGPQLYKDTSLWFKSKIDRFNVMCTQLKSGLHGTKNKQEYAVKLADMLVAEPRLEQGLEYLKEFGLNIDLASTRSFINWVTDDVLKEHDEDIPADVKPMAVKAIGQKAGAWYRAQVTIE